MHGQELNLDNFKGDFLIQKKKDGNWKIVCTMAAGQSMEVRWLSPSVLIHLPFYQNPRLNSYQFQMGLPGAGKPL